MDEKIEINEKAVRKSARQEKTFVDMLNQEVNDLKTNMETANLENELSNIQTYSYMDIYPCRQKQSNRIVAEHLIMKGYRKESDTVKEVLGKVLKFTLDDEVGMRYLIKNLAKEYGVELK